VVQVAPLRLPGVLCRVHAVAVDGASAVAGEVHAAVDLRVAG
jgi:hypothetical protein